MTRYSGWARAMLSAAWKPMFVVPPVTRTERVGFMASSRGVSDRVAQKGMRFSHFVAFAEVLRCCFRVSSIRRTNYLINKYTRLLSEEGVSMKRNHAPLCAGHSSLACRACKAQSGM